jgi:beta-lactamase regulating signal transducer with metallopeptidase domain
MRRSSANSRYLVACIALAGLALMPVATFLSVYTSSPVASVNPPAAAGIEGFAFAAKASWLSELQTWILPAWCLGVLLLSIRLVWGGKQIMNLRYSGSKPEESVKTRVSKMADRIGLRRPVGVLISKLVDGPSVVGLLRPAILLPAATLMHLTPEQLESILAHELAHIRRHDHLINAAQMVIETLLFYHPAVWWTSARIRRERELCCDDDAVRACGDSLCYARALTALERFRAAAPALASGERMARSPIG